MLQKITRNLIFVFCIMFSMLVSAQQIQHGYVKTRGKLIDGKVIKGKRIPDVAISINGVNTIISSNTGEFSFPVQNNSFSIRSVRKSGYSLVDSNILKQEFSYSPNPLVILVEDNIELSQEKIRLTRQIRLNLQRRLEEKEEELGKQRAQNKITSNEYNSLIKEVYAEHSRSEGLIENIVDHSMGIDYCMVDEYNALVQENIIAGNLAKADSLISSRDLSQRLLQLNKMRLELQENESQIEYAQSEFLRQEKTLAEELKIKSQLYIQENDLDSALLCLSYRIDIDSTAYNYYLDKAILLRDKFPEKAHESEILFAKSIYHAIGNHDKFVCSIEYGTFFQQNGEFDKAISQYSNAKNLVEPEDSISKAHVLTKLGIAYNSMRNYDEALSYYQQALSYITSTQLDFQKRSAELYNNIGVVYENQSKYGRALDANYKALQIRQGLYIEDPDNPDIAMSYSNIASVYDNIEAWEQAIKYYKKAIEIYENNKGNIELAYVYNNISSCYYNADSIGPAWKFANLSLIAMKFHYSNSNPIAISIKENFDIINKELEYVTDHFALEDVIIEQIDWGYYFRIHRDLVISEMYFKLALENEERLYKKNPNRYRTNLATAYENLLSIYEETNNIEQYDLYLECSLKLYKELYSSQPSLYVNDIINMQNRKIWRLLANNKVNEAIVLAQETYKMDESNETSKEYLAECYNSKSYEYANTLDYVNAHKSIDIAISMFPKIATFYDTKGEIFLMQGQEEKALAIWRKLLKLNPEFLKGYPDGTNLSNGLKKLGLIE